MAHSRNVRIRRSTALAYLIAVLGSGLVISTRLVPEGSQRSFWASLAFLCAVSAAGALGGWKPGFLTTALSALGAAFLLARPSVRIAGTADLLRISGTAVAGIAISILCECFSGRGGGSKRGSAGFAALDQLQIVTDSMSAAVSHCSRDFKYLWVSKSYADWIGLPVEKIVGRPLLDIVGREAMEQLRPRFDESLRGKQVQYEEVVEVKGLGRRWIHSVCTPTRDAAGVPDGWVSVVLDTTERRQMEQALRDSEERFARFMQFLPGMAWIKDLEGRYVYANDSAFTIFGRPRDVLYGKTDREVFSPEEAAQFTENDHKAAASQTGVQLVETLKHRDGVLHHSIVSKFPILGEDDRPAFVGGIAIDITDRLRAEKVRAESEARFRQLAETIDEVFWMSNIDVTETLYISPAYERIWGRSCESLYEKPGSFLDAVHPDDRERVRAFTLGQLDREEPTEEEYRIVTPSGSVRWIRDRAFPVRDASGRVFRTAGIAADITEKKEAEEVAQGRRPPQGRIPGDARTRAAQSAGPHLQRRRADAMRTEQPGGHERRVRRAQKAVGAPGAAD